MRINKFLADAGIASRRTIDSLIASGRVTINGVRLEKLGYRVSDGDSIAIDGKRVEIKKKQACVTILFNKPPECITTASDTHGRKTVLDYVHVKERIFPIGRLDKDTTGVLLLTNDGELANALMHPRHGAEKVYHAHLDKPLTANDKKHFETGIVLDERKTAPCFMHYFKNDRKDVIITLHEGRNRQIHRTFNTLGYTVQKLDRISYAGLAMGRLKQGAWRYLVKKEVDRLESLWKSKTQSSSTNGRMARILR